MPSHVMIDLETLSTRTNAVILSMGIVKFNPYKKGVFDRLELKPTIEDQTEKYQRHIDDSTIQWWSQQSPEAIEAAFSEEGRVPFEECMRLAYKFCLNQDRVWSNGASFDVVVCESAFFQTIPEKTHPVPWPFYSIRDTRTIYEIAGVSLRDDKYVTTHNALEDAIHQAEIVQAGYRKLIAAGFLGNGT